MNELPQENIEQKEAVVSDEARIVSELLEKVEPKPLVEAVRAKHFNDFQTANWEEMVNQLEGKWVAISTRQSSQSATDVREVVLVKGGQAYVFNSSGFFNDTGISRNVASELDTFLEEAGFETAGPEVISGPSRYSPQKFLRELGVVA